MSFTVKTEISNQAQEDRTMHSKELTRQQIIDSEFTIECPICNDILIGNEPRSLIVCNKCRKEIIDLPDGWTCIECGDEYLEDTEGQLVADYTEGTLCRKCNQQRVPGLPYTRSIMLCVGRGK